MRHEKWVSPKCVGSTYRESWKIFKNYPNQNQKVSRFDKDDFSHGIFSSRDGSSRQSSWSCLWVLCFFWVQTFCCLKNGRIPLHIFLSRHQVSARDAKRFMAVSQLKDSRTGMTNVQFSTAAWMIIHHPVRDTSQYESSLRFRLGLEGEKSRPGSVRGSFCSTFLFEVAGYMCVFLLFGTEKSDKHPIFPCGVDSGNRPAHTDLWKKSPPWHHWPTDRASLSTSPSCGQIAKKKALLFAPIQWRSFAGVRAQAQSTSRMQTQVRSTHHWKTYMKNGV